MTLKPSSLDVTHGFFQKALGIDLEISPGKTTEWTFTPQKPGRYPTICDHFCGSGHGNMKMTIVVEKSSPVRAWSGVARSAGQSAPAPWWLQPAT